MLFKIRRIVACMLVIALTMLPLMHFSVAASEIDAEVSIEDADKNKLIDELFARRMTLEHDYENNRASIEEIDRHLMFLGVEKISSGDAMRILGDDMISPMWSPISTSTIQWTSRKLITTFRGSQFEVQIIEGVPISGSNELRKNYAEVAYAAEGLVAGVSKAVAVTSVNLAAEIIGGPLQTGITIIGMLEDAADPILESLETSTVLDRVEGVALVSFTGHMKYVYVKPYQTTDANYQGLYYYGNSVSCLITTIMIIDRMENGELITEHSTETRVEGTIQSLYYDDYSKAVENYWNYKYNNMTDFKQDYTVHYVKLTLMEEEHSFALPWATHPGRDDS